MDCENKQECLGVLATTAAASLTILSKSFSSKRVELIKMSANYIPRGPLLILAVLIIAVFVLRSFFGVPKFGRKYSADFVHKPAGSIRIKMLTFNIWFSPDKMAERMEALGKIVQDLKPDILTFQEVTRVNLGLLRKQPWFSRYHLTPPDAERHPGYFVVILSRFPIEKWQTYPFEDSPYQRELLTAEIKFNLAPKTRKFVIATTHLEHSGRSSKLREKHLKETVKMLSTFENVCVMGDMNLERQFDGDVVLPVQWIDAWLAIPGHKDSNGYTWDERRNPFIVRERESTLKDRLDRVFCKLSGFKVKEVTVVDDRMTKSGVLPSDHFGIFTVLEASKKTSYNKKNSQAEKGVYFKRP